MLQALFDYFYNLFDLYLPITDESLEFLTSISIDVGDGHFIVLAPTEYFALLCALISLIFIVILCCLFVYKIVRLIGGLIR